MPVIACPKCAANLRVPEGSVAQVRCPKCQLVFAPPTAAEFEVVEELPPPRAAPRTPPRAVPRDPEPEQDFEVIDEADAPRSRRRRDEDDDDYDDRPRGRGRDRGRGRRREYDDEYGTSDRGAPFRRGKLACLLLSISIWLYLGALGVMTLFILLMWAGANVSPGLFALPGIAGAANWLVAAVGLGFAIAGPPKAKGMAIAATSVAGVHLILLIVCFAESQGGGGAGLAFGIGGVAWGLMVSMIPVVDLLIPGLVVESKMITSEFLVAFLTGALEIARLILILLMMKAMARSARDAGAAEKNTAGVMVVSVVCGAVALVAALVVVIVSEGKLMSTGRTLLPLTAVLGYVAYTCMLIVPGMAAVETKDALDRRS